jgi:hypothetical protein
MKKLFSLVAVLSVSAWLVGCGASEPAPKKTPDPAVKAGPAEGEKAPAEDKPATEGTEAPVGEEKPVEGAAAPEGEAAPAGEEKAPE